MFDFVQKKQKKNKNNFCLFVVLAFTQAFVRYECYHHFTECLSLNQKKKEGKKTYCLDDVSLVCKIFYIFALVWCHHRFVFCWRLWPMLYIIVYESNIAFLLYISCVTSFKFLLLLFLLALGVFINIILIALKGPIAVVSYVEFCKNYKNKRKKWNI